MPTLTAADTAPKSTPIPPSPPRLPATREQREAEHQARLAELADRGIELPTASENPDADVLEALARVADTEAAKRHKDAQHALAYRKKAAKVAHKALAALPVDASSDERRPLEDEARRADERLAQAEGRAQNAANRGQKAVALDALAAETGLDPRALSDALRRLHNRGLVSKWGGRVGLNQHGAWKEQTLSLIALKVADGGGVANIRHLMAGYRRPDTFPLGPLRWLAAEGRIELHPPGVYETTIDDFRFAVERLNNVDKRPAVLHVTLPRSALARAVDAYRSLSPSDRAAFREEIDR